MNREEFMRQLESLLSGISAEERQDAITFYNSYFDEAEGSEADVIAELGSPQKVAESILADLGIQGNGSFYNSKANRDAEYYKNVNQTNRSYGGYGGPSYRQNNNSINNKSTGWKVLAIVLLVLTSPIWLCVLMAILGVIIGLAGALFGVAVAVIVVMLTLVVGGFVMLGTGSSLLVTGSAPVGIGVLGGGLIVLALGIVAVVLMVWIIGVFLPWAVKGLYKLCKKPFNNGKGNI